MHYVDKRFKNTLAEIRASRITCVENKYSFIPSVPMKKELDPSPILIDFALRNGRREAFLYNNRMHIINTGTGAKTVNPEQYEVNRNWILENFKS